MNGVSNNRNSGYGNNDRNERSPYGGGVQFNEGGFDGYNGGGYRGTVSLSAYNRGGDYSFDPRDNSNHDDFGYNGLTGYVGKGGGASYSGYNGLYSM